MRRTSPGLERLRTTLLAACGLSLSACTSVPAELPPPDQTPKQTTDEAPANTTAPSEPTVTPEPPPAVATACGHPTPIFIANEDSGFVACDDGAINRASAQRCSEPITESACQGTETHRDCQTHADCTDKPHGFCMGGSGQIGSYCGCVYPCLDDSECGANEACLCPEVSGDNLGVSRCAPATCTVDADCPSGECGATYFFDGCGYELSLQCRTGEDACRSDPECGGRAGACAAQHDRDGGLTSFQCAGRHCVIGRPLSVDGGARVAAVTARAWGQRATSIASGSTAARSDARAAYWLEVAQMEHASVASFARFAHELMRFGAPPELLRGALAAAADEVRHAEQTFALASIYAGAPVGPGPLRVDDLEPAATFELFVTRLIREACVGETLGVAEALALLDHELDPALAPVAQQIAADETRHAALAWRTLRWAAPRVDPDHIDRVFRRSIAALAHVEPDQPADPAHGLLGTAARRRVRAQAVAEIIEPCWQGLRARSSLPLASVRS